jgi:hypothetical protein
MTTLRSSAATAVGIQVWDLALSLPTEGEGAARRPTVRALRARLSNEVVRKLLARLGMAGNLLDGGAELKIKVQGVEITARLAASVPGNGCLRLEATQLRLGGWLPVPVGLVELALGQIEGKPGLHRAGPRAVDLDLAGLLSPLPVRWETGIRRARVTGDYLEVECAAK